MAGPARQSRKGVGRVSQERQTRTKRKSRRATKQDVAGDDGDDIETSNDCDGSDLDQIGPPLRYLACPYYKHDPVQHMACIRLRMKRLRDVKQHLYRRHSRYMQCPTCGKEFRDSQAFEDHVRQRACEGPAGGFPIKGVTETQRKLLNRRVNRRDSEEDQWFSIWEILFPGSGRPGCVYLTNEFDEAVSMIRNTWRSQARDIIETVATKDEGGGESSWSTEDRRLVMERSEAAVQELLQRVKAGSQGVAGSVSSPQSTSGVASSVYGEHFVQPTEACWAPKTSPEPLDSKQTGIAWPQDSEPQPSTITIDLTTEPNNTPPMWPTAGSNVDVDMAISPEDDSPFDVCQATVGMASWAELAHIDSELLEQQLTQSWVFVSDSMESTPGSDRLPVSFAPCFPPNNSPIIPDYPVGPYGNLMLES